MDRRAQKVVLVAEDMDFDFALLERAFHEAGFSHRLIHVHSGSKAIQYLKGEAPFEDRVCYPRPDLIVLYANMPQGGGADVLTYMRETGCKTPAVFLSGSALPGDLENAIALGAAESLWKPDAISDLVVVAQTMHHKWLSGNS